MRLSRKLLAIGILTSVIAIACVVEYSISSNSTYEILAILIGMPGCLFYGFFLGQDELESDKKRHYESQHSLDEFK